MSQHAYQMLASLARDKATFAMHQGNPDRAAAWIRVAAEADRADATGEPGQDAIEAAGNSIADELTRIADALDRLTKEIVDSARIGH